MQSSFDIAKELTRDVVGRGLALALDKDGQVGSILAIPRVERLEDLQTLRLGRDSNIHRRAVLGRCLVRVVARVEAVLWQALARRLPQLELVAILVLERVGERVEVQAARNGHGDHEVG